MLKNILKLGTALDKAEQKIVNGGGKVFGPVCVAPYLTSTLTCIPGYHLHPQGHCICCRD